MCGAEKEFLCNKVVFTESSDPLFVQVPFKKGLAKGRE